MSFATDYQAEGRPGSMTPRGVFVPPWYKSHEDLTTPVLDLHGKPMGFTVGQVCVERRWAIGPNGQVLAGHEFTDKLTEWYLGQWQWLNPPQAPLPIDTISYPTSENYVAHGPDPANPRRVVDLLPANWRRKPDSSPPVSERPVDPTALAKAGWKPAPATPKKDGE